ncbi:MAG: YggS family pyridoxal phosphate-dependent enzyme [Clostridia bacterium]|nr:YggS family pyridoxal phosphate-dependent enzyme [Clostridia bacterium]
MDKIQENVEKIKAELANGNPFGESVMLVAATKTQTAERINAAILAGVDAVAENRVQEFRDKAQSLLPCPQHFIGHLQTNKVKYLVGKVALIHSCDRDELAQEISRLSLLKGVESSVLLQVNIGREATKGGYAPEEAFAAFERLNMLPNLKIQGFMAMLPNTDELPLLKKLTGEMRVLFERARDKDSGIETLSVGMSGDYRLCVEQGSNAVRIGSGIFGARDYGAGAQ